MNYSSFFTLLFVSTFSFSAVADSYNIKAINPHAELKYSADFTHLDCANPNAPKGGEYKSVMPYDFDSLDPYYWNNNYGNKPAPQIRGLYFETLLEESVENDGSHYPLVAESMDIATDFSYVIFNIRPEAIFHNGDSITAEDILFSYETMRKSTYYYDKQAFLPVVGAEVISPKRIKFNLEVNGKLHAYITIANLGFIHAFQKKYTEAHPQNTWKAGNIPLASGPYNITFMKNNTKVVYERRHDYWGKDIPVRKGRYNFDKVVYESYSTDAARMAYRRGFIDLLSETDLNQWLSLKADPPKNTQFIEVTPNGPRSYYGLGMNFRRPHFKDRRVRKALALAYDFNTTNRLFDHGQKELSFSFFQNTDFASTKELSEPERKILDYYGSAISHDAYSSSPSVAENLIIDPTRSFRTNLLEAHHLLEVSGWKIVNGKRVNKNGQKFVLNLVYYSTNREEEKNYLVFKKDLARLGIELNLVPMDESSYVNTIKQRDFDIITFNFRNDYSPIIEDLEATFTSKFNDDPSNITSLGLNNPVLDDLIQKFKDAKEREEKIILARALDRILLSENYVISTGVGTKLRYAASDKMDFVRLGKDDDGSNPLSNWWMKKD